MNNKLLIGGIIVIVGGLLIAGRFTTNPTPSAGTASVHNLSANSNNAKSAPDFTLQKLGGGTISLSEFIGKKPVVVDFWASWCPNCRRDMPNLNRFYEKYKDRVEVIGVNLQEKESTIQNFINSHGISFPIALDPSGSASRAFGIQYTNTHVLIDINGNLVRTIPGDIRESDIESLVNSQPVSRSDQTSAPDEKPCEIALADGGDEAGICKNENL
ncbi:MAG: TlpA disulfide reductase family protein [Patescibacteria group bacterium]